MNTRTERYEPLIGRPSEFTQETADAICLRISEGESLRKVCRDEDMPTRTTVYRWLHAVPSFRVQYRRARELLAEHWADELVDIADDTALDTVTKVTPQGREYEAVDHEHIQRSKLRVDTRKWLMSKLKPGQYGDRVEHEMSGQIEHRHGLSDQEVVRRLALFLVESPAGGQVIEGSLAPPADSQDDQPE